MSGVVYAKSAVKYLRKQPKNVRLNVIDRIEAYAQTPNAAEHQVKKLQGSDYVRLRVGDLRVIMDWQNAAPRVLLVLTIGSRGDVYKR